MLRPALCPLPPSLFPSLGPSPTLALRLDLSWPSASAPGACPFAAVLAPIRRAARPVHDPSIFSDVEQPPSKYAGFYAVYANAPAAQQICRDLSDLCTQTRLPPSKSAGMSQICVSAPPPPLSPPPLTAPPVLARPYQLCPSQPCLSQPESAPF